MARIQELREETSKVVESFDIVMEVTGSALTN